VLDWRAGGCCFRFAPMTPSAYSRSLRDREKDNWNSKKVCKNKSFVGKRGVTQRPVSVFLLAFDEKLPYHF
jgi:hypothetical protein